MNSHLSHYTDEETEAQSREVTCLRPRGYQRRWGLPAGPRSSRAHSLSPACLPWMRTPRLAVVASHVLGPGPPFPHLGAHVPPAPSRSGLPWSLICPGMPG